MARGKVDRLLPEKFTVNGESYTVLRRGWPDCLLVHESGKVIFVEEKVGYDRLSVDQLTLFEAFRKVGVTVYILDENCSLTPFFEHSCYHRATRPKALHMDSRNWNKVPKNL